MNESGGEAAPPVEPDPSSSQAPAPELRIRVLRRDAVGDRDVARMLAAIIESFGSWPPFDPGVPPEDHLRWKMASPAGDLAAIVGEIGDELACCQICVSQRVRIGREVVSRVRSADFAVRPAFRGRGAATLLAAKKTEVLERPTLRLVESRHAAILHLSRKAGAEPLGNPVRAMVLPLDARRMAERLGGGWRGTVARTLGPALVIASRRRRRLALEARPAIGPTVRRLDRFDRRFAVFVEKAASVFEVAVERTPEYLNWRYRDPRGGRWAVDAVEEEGSIVGYAAWKVEAGRGLLGDLLALPDRFDVVAALVDAAVAGAEAEGAASVLCWLPARHPYRRVLREGGFVSRAAGVTHLVRPECLSAEAAAILAAPSARIHFTIGDSDFV